MDEEEFFTEEVDTDDIQDLSIDYDDYMDTDYYEYTTDW